MYPSKILLFGEYTVLLKSYALAIPYYGFKGEWAFMDRKTMNNSDAQRRSNDNIKEFLEYYRMGSGSMKPEYPLDIKALEKDLENGQYFRSNIPEGSGLGSSGALVAAIFDKYSATGEPDREYVKIRRSLALLESYYHGTSSGFDPLVSYLKSPVLLSENGIRLITEKQIKGPLQHYGMFLVYHKQRRNNGKLVNYFNNKCKSDPGYLSKLQKYYIPVNNECIISFLDQSDTMNFFSAVRKITLLQIEMFNEMIPEELIPSMQYGIDNKLFCLKICGSGGGGFYLGFTENRVKTESYFNTIGHHISFIE